MIISMISKTKISLIAVMAIAGMLVIPAYSMASAIEPIELSDELKEELKKISPERQPHMEKIFQLGEQKLLTESDSEKQALEDLMEEELVKLGETEEKNRKVYADNSQLRVIKEKIRATEEIPIDSIMVGKNKLTVVLQEGSENQGWEKVINGYVPNADLNVEIAYGTVALEEWSCTSWGDDCDPLHGGLEIRKGGSGTNCTLGLPVEQGSTSGYLTAGHCYDVDDEVHQPYDNWFEDWQIGTVQTGDSIYNADCDCAFIEDSNSRTNESKIWLSSGFSSSITGTQVPTDGEILDISGAAGGNYDEEVMDNDFYNVGLGNRILLEYTGNGDGGDSGAPVYDISDHDLVGTISGVVQIPPGGANPYYIVVVPWAEISDSSTGLGVSLL